MKRTSKPRVNLKINPINFSKITSNAFSTPISIRKKAKKNHSRFASSIEYFTKLYEQSAASIPNVNTSNNITKSNKDLIKSHSKYRVYRTEKNSPQNLPRKVIGFISSMNSLQKAITNKEDNVKELKKTFEIEKKDLIQEAKKSLERTSGKNTKSESNLLKYHQMEQKYIGTNINININKDKENEYKQVIHQMKKEITALKRKNENYFCTKSLTDEKGTQINLNSNKDYVKECYGLLKNIYLFVKEKEKKYNIDFNYSKSDYENINYSMCYDNDSDSSKLFNVCTDINKEIINLINSMTDNFERIKGNFNDKIRALNEESKKDKKEILEYKNAMNDYLSSASNITTSLYTSSDIIKIFKKIARDSKMKQNAQEDYQKDLKAYKLMNDSYKQALQEAQNTIASIEKQNELYKNIKDNSVDKEILLKQIEVLKKELSESKDKIRKLQEENCQRKETNYEPIINAMQKLILEINLNQKVKDYLYVIFKCMGLSDMQITNIYLMKEKKKKYITTLFKK